MNPSTPRPRRFALLLVIPLLLGLLGAAAPATYTTHRGINDGGSIDLTEIGGCQYVVAYRYGTGVSIVHHAACTNPAHAKTP